MIYERNCEIIYQIAGNLRMYYYIVFGQYIGNEKLLIDLLILIRGIERIVDDDFIGTYCFVYS